MVCNDCLKDALVSLVIDAAREEHGQPHMTARERNERLTAILDGLFGEEGYEDALTAA